MAFARGQCISAVICRLTADCRWNSHDSGRRGVCSRIELLCLWKYRNVVVIYVVMSDGGIEWLFNMEHGIFSVVCCDVFSYD